MKPSLHYTATLFVCCAVTGEAAAQGPQPQPASPGVITQGSSSVGIGGRPAARTGDATDQGAPVVEGSPNVFIDGRPAATLGSRTGCGGITHRRLIERLHQRQAGRPRR